MKRPFGRRPRQAKAVPFAGRYPAAHFNWQPCRGGCGARTLDGNPCAVCLQRARAKADAEANTDPTKENT